MDIPSGTSSMVNVSPPKKRTRLDLGALSIAEKQVMINMYKNIVSKEPEIKTVAIVAKIVDTMGVAQSTVYRTIKEYRESGTVTSPKRRGGRPSVLATYDEATRNSLRQLVHSFFHKNEIPTLNTILNEIQKRPDFPKISRSSLYELMKSINFKYMKRNRKSILIERDDIVRWRANFLRTIKKYRMEGRAIYYLDETWINEGHTKEKVWIDQNIQNRRDAFIEGLSTGLKNPSGKGKRLIILHIGSESGFVEEGLLIFEGKKTADYHEEMNAAVFEEWFGKVLSKLQDNAVIVMDNASYHSRKLEKIPTSSSRKNDIQAWLKLKDINFDIDMGRAELLHLVHLHKNKFNMYVTDEMAKNDTKIVLRLPPYHCELNPIEMIWAKIKNEVASKNCTFKLKDVKQHFLKAVENVTSTDWSNSIKHVIKEEEKMCRLVGIMDDLIEPFIISLGADGADSDTSSSEDSDNMYIYDY